MTAGGSPVLDHTVREAGVPGVADQSAEQRVYGRNAAGRWQHWILGLLVVVSATVTLAASRHNSTTFDEIFATAAGARGYETGRFDLVRDHPRLLLYLYGLPTFLARPNYPSDEFAWGYDTRWNYSQDFFFRSGNDPERLALAGRTAGAASVVVLGLLVFAFVRRTSGDSAALLAALLTLFLPDVLAHGGVAYNDVPIAAMLFGAAWAIDAAARDPRTRMILAAAVVATLAVAMKFTAIALLPMAAAVVVAEAIVRAEERGRYLRQVLVGSLLALPVVYFTLVAIYLGDFSLTEFRWGLDFNVLHAAKGHGPVPAWLAGATTPGGFWYFFPVAFLIKTPAALHMLVLLAVLGFCSRATVGRRHEGAARERNTAWLRSNFRMPVVGGLVLLAFLLTSNLNIGFRHALPMMPFLLVLVAEGVRRLWTRSATAMRATIVGLTLWSAASALSFYPYFLTYTSEYNADRELGYRLLVDSSMDWGQGLIALRNFMRDEGIDRVYLSYFGSALPEAYGIDYVPLQSFFSLPPVPMPPEPPRYLVVSATNLAGVYVDDAFAALRTMEPYAILANSMFVYRIEDEAGT